MTASFCNLCAAERGRVMCLLVSGLAAGVIAGCASTGSSVRQIALVSNAVARGSSGTSLRGDVVRLPAVRRRGARIVGASRSSEAVQRRWLARHLRLTRAFRREEARDPAMRKLLGAERGARLRLRGKLAHARSLVRSAIAANPNVCIARAGGFSAVGANRRSRAAVMRRRKLVLRCVADSVAGARSLRAAQPARARS
jgi:hypothetical protein